MEGYFSVGAVSKKKNVSIKSLRYYDKIGILKPAYTNPVTKYRYYTEEQLYLLDAISLCIDLGIPLSNFEQYSEDGNFQLQKLLYDGKELAEKRILEIRDRLKTVQLALQALDYKPLPMHVNKPPEGGIRATVTKRKRTPKSAVVEDSLYTRYIAPRYILTSKLQDDVVCDYGQTILRLFMLAQLLGISAEYPSGMLYQYDSRGVPTKYIFICLSGVGRLDDSRVMLLPGGEYICCQNSERMIDEAERIYLQSGHKVRSRLVIETDIMDDSLKKGDNSLELQLLL